MYKNRIEQLESFHAGDFDLDYIERLINDSLKALDHPSYFDQRAQLSNSSLTLEGILNIKLNLKMS